MASTIQVDKVQDTGGNTILSSNSTGTFTYEAASGANFTALDADNISAGTLAIARGGTGAATLAAAGLANTPSFSVWLNASQGSVASATWTKVAFDDEEWDTDSAFASNKFTVPAGAGGKYHFNVQIQGADLTDNKYIESLLYLNGNQVTSIAGSNRYLCDHRQVSPGTNNITFTSSFILSLSATDYVEVYVYQTNTGAMSLDFEMANFSGYKLIGA